MPKFRTKWNCVINDGETFEPGTSLVQPGQSESLEHIVQRLTRKPNPTMRDLYILAKETGQAFEDPTQMTDEQLQDRLDRVVAPGDNIDAAEALLSAQNDFFEAQTAAVNEPESQAQRETTVNATREDEQKHSSESA